MGGIIKNQNYFPTLYQQLGTSYTSQQRTRKQEINQVGLERVSFLEKEIV